MIVSHDVPEMLQRDDEERQSNRNGGAGLQPHRGRVGGFDLRFEFVVVGEETGIGIGIQAARASI